jgi:hypothetical protein
MPETKSYNWQVRSTLASTLHVFQSLAICTWLMSVYTETTAERSAASGFYLRVSIGNNVYTCTFYVECHWSLLVLTEQQTTGSVSNCRYPSTQFATRPWVSLTTMFYRTTVPMSGGGGVVFIGASWMLPGSRSNAVNLAGSRIMGTCMYREVLSAIVFKIWPLQCYWGQAEKGGKSHYKSFPFHGWQSIFMIRYSFLTIYFLCIVSFLAIHFLCIGLLLSDLFLMHRSPS